MFTEIFGLISKIHFMHWEIEVNAFYKATGNFCKFTDQESGVFLMSEPLRSLIIKKNWDLEVELILLHLTYQIFVGDQMFY